MSMRYPVRVAVTPLLIISLSMLWAQDGPESVLRGTKQFSKKVVISGLAGPWELTWGPDSMLWVTERTGKRIIRVDPATGGKNVAITLDEVSVPGGQDGLLGMALHPDLLLNKGNDYVYAAYTYVDKSKSPSPFITDPNSPYRYLYLKVVRLTYDKATGTLAKPVTLIDGIPTANDHNAGRLKIGPDRKLYLSVGDEGHNQLGNFCLPIQAQRLPTKDEIKNKSYDAYVGKSLRIDLDGSIPTDNPKLAGVVSHVFTYGHRNMQGLDFGPDGTLYESEQGPKTDDEVNILKAGSNYGWPHVAGFQDDKAYEYARWADATTPCSQLTFSDLRIDPSVPRSPESAFKEPFVEPIATMFTVPAGFNFGDPSCKGVDIICWPTVGASSIEYYESKGTGIPGWDKVLLVTTLKRGSLYVLPLTPDGKRANGHFSRYFQSENRYRDTAISPDRKTIYVATDPSGLAEGLTRIIAMKMADPGAILAFTYVGEGTATPPGQQPQSISEAGPAKQAPAAAAGVPPQYTPAEAAAGKDVYNSNCAVCHGNTMTNGTFGPPLAGEYFRNTWSGRTVSAFYDKARTMPPAAPGSLEEATYKNILAYILQVNGVPSVPAVTNSLEQMTIPQR